MGTLYFIVHFISKIQQDNIQLKRNLIDAELEKVNKSIDDKPLSDLVRDANEGSGDDPKQG